MLKQVEDRLNGMRKWAADSYDGKKDENGRVKGTGAAKTGKNTWYHPGRGWKPISNNKEGPKTSEKGRRPKDEPENKQK